MSHSWGYTKQDGPATWASKFPTAAGSRQSPINIVTSAVAPGNRRSMQQPLSWSYAPTSVRAITNTGHGWKVDVDGGVSTLTGGPLTHRHRLLQFHCHWGSNSKQGSEHTIDGRSYAAELHLVHWNSGKYSSAEEASGKPDGLAVLGVLLKIGDANPEIEKITSLIPEIPFKGQKIPIKTAIDMAKMLPPSHSYWTYLGSLTTPPCSEVVTWILFKEPMEVSEQQLQQFRKMHCYGKGEECPCDELKGLIIDNFRPPLDLGSRTLSEYAF